MNTPLPTVLLAALVAAPASAQLPVPPDAPPDPPTVQRVRRGGGAARAPEARPTSSRAPRGQPTTSRGQPTMGELAARRGDPGVRRARGPAHDGLPQRLHSRDSGASRRQASGSSARGRARGGTIAETEPAGPLSGPTPPGEPRPGQVRSAAREHFRILRNEEGQVEFRMPLGRDRLLVDPTVRERVLRIEGTSISTLARAVGPNLLAGDAPLRVGAPRGPLYVTRTQFHDEASSQTVVVDSWFQQRAGLLEHVHDAVYRIGSDLRFRYGPHVSRVETLRGS